MKSYIGAIVFLGLANAGHVQQHVNSLRSAQNLAQSQDGIFDYLPSMKVFSQDDADGEESDSTQTGGQAPDKQDPNKAPNKRQVYQEVVISRKEEVDKEQDEESLPASVVKEARQNTVKEIISNNPNLGRPDTDDSNAVEGSDASLDPSTALQTAEKDEEKKEIFESSAEENQGLGNDKLGEGTEQKDIPGLKEKVAKSKEGDKSESTDGEGNDSSESTDGEGNDNSESADGEGNDAEVAKTEEKEESNASGEALETSA